MIAETFAAFALAAGCGGAPMEQQIPVHRSRRYGVTVDTLGVEGIVPAPATRVWEALPRVLGDLGLDINFREVAGRRQGSCYQKLRRRLGSWPLSELVDCGDSRGLPNADRFEIALTVLTTVVPTGERTAKVYTFVLGVGAEASGAAGNRVWCYSKGTLEERIRTHLEAATASS